MGPMKSIGVVGGGISGLYAALLLRREGHQVTVFEASDRIGGRIHTHRFQPLNENEEPYFEAGAMRIPRSVLHQRVYHLIRYLNTHGAREDKIELIPYILEHENNESFVRGQKVKPSDSGLISGFDIPKEFQGKSARSLLADVVTPWLETLRIDFDQGFETLLAYDEISFRQYLRLVCGWPHAVIEFVELMMSQTNQYDLSFTEIVMQNLDFDTKEWTTIRGGMSRLPENAAKLLDSREIHLNSPITTISELPDGRVALGVSGDVFHTAIFDKVILAIPPAAIHNIRDRPIWPFMKQQFIRGAHFEPLYKIGFHFRTRFWEHSSCPSFGGQSVTDLRIRWVVYPSNDLGSDGSGVLLLYSWMTDASRWQSMPREERIELALHDLQVFFSDSGVDVYDQYVAAYDVPWSCENATGDAMFLPGQYTRFAEVAKRPEGNVYFAGEHLSRHHTWIAGAIESTLSTVAELLERKNLAALGEEFLQHTDVTHHKEKHAVPDESSLGTLDDIDLQSTKEALMARLVVA
ncbi:MAG: hypothetical protein Q9195_007310 [Heterodermia aff. obscurata]